ncbi:hypothetical protein Tco_0360459 [Tanacetum coccineum]
MCTASRKLSMDSNKLHVHGLQVSQNPRGIFINQSKYAQEILKKFGFDSCTPIDTPMAERPNLDEDKGGKLIDPTRFREADLSIPKKEPFTWVCGIRRYSTVEQKAFAMLTKQDVMTHGEVLLVQLNFLDTTGYWSSKKQKSAISTTEAEYSPIRMLCSNTLDAVLTADYDLRSTKFRLYCDNQKAVKVKVVDCNFVETKYQLADILRRPYRRALRNSTPTAWSKQMSPVKL